MIEWVINKTGYINDLVIFSELKKSNHDDYAIALDLNYESGGYKLKPEKSEIHYIRTSDDSSLIFDDKKKCKIIKSKTDIIDGSKKILKYSFTDKYRLFILKTNEHKKRYILLDRDTKNEKVIGEGIIDFTNDAITLTTEIYFDKFIKVKAGVGRENKAVYNLYNIDKGEFLLNDFVYNIAYNKDTETIDVQTYKDSRNVIQYDLDGNVVDKDNQKTIVYPKDKLRKIKIHGNNKVYTYWLVKGYSREYTIYKDYDYGKNEFVGEICSFDYAHSYRNTTGISMGGTYDCISSYTQLFKERDWNTEYNLVADRCTFVFRDFDYNLCKLVDNGYEMAPVIIYSPKNKEEGADFGNLYIGDNGTLYISALEPSDKKIYIVREDGKIIHSDDCYSYVKRNSYGGYSIERVYSDTGSIYGVLDKQGYFKKNIKRNETDGCVFMRFVNGKVEEIKLVDDVIDVHDKVDNESDKITITIVGDNNKVYKYDDKFNPIETPDLQTVAVQGMYMTLDRSEDICYVSQFSEDLKRYSIGKYRPKQVKEALRMSLDRNNENQLIAFYATRLDENGNEKWSFFCVNGENGSKPENGMFQIGEFDSIELRHKGWWSNHENDIISCSSKSDFANNIFICKNEGEETKYLGIGFNEDGTMRLVKKRPVD